MSLDDFSWQTLWHPERVGMELQYVALIVALFIVPQVLQRWRLPPAITCFLLGVAGGMGLELFPKDETVKLLSTFGIVALFLFAGLEADVALIRRQRRVLVQHLLARFGLLVAATVVLHQVFPIPTRAAALVALALLTPSAGFILHSLHLFGLLGDDVDWVKAKVVATELLALGTLFVTLQSASLPNLLAGLAMMGAMVAVLPPVFRFFARKIFPHAPLSEFAFLLVMALSFALVTKAMGTYYLLGAFIVGMSAQRLQQVMPAITSQRMFNSLEMFAAFFIPLYFFQNGLLLRRHDFTLETLVIGVALLAVFLPLHVGSVLLHRMAALREPFRRGYRIALSLMPTLVFTLVMVDVLRTRFDVPSSLLGGLVIYTLVNTLLPGFLLRDRLPDYGHPQVAKSRP